MKEKTEKRKRKSTLLEKRNRMGYLFIMPWFVGFILFYVRSIIYTGIFSFSNLKMSMTGYTLEFAGLENYVYAFGVHPQFKKVLTESLINMVIDVPLIIFFSLFIAILLNRKFKGRGFVRAIFFLPVILNSSAIKEAIILSESLISGGIAAVNPGMTEAGNTAVFGVEYLVDLFSGLGIPAVILNYITEAVNRLYSIIEASGVQIVIFIAACQSIPSSMLEVARIEGATGYETFWKVIFPMVSPHIITNVVYTIVDSFTSSKVVELAYTTAFDEFNYGLSSVFSIVSTLATCLILLLVTRFISKRTFYYN